MRNWRVERFIASPSIVASRGKSKKCEEQRSFTVALRSLSIESRTVRPPPLHPVGVDEVNLSTLIGVLIPLVFALEFAIVCIGLYW
jgi:hypothetical protein